MNLRKDFLFGRLGVVMGLGVCGVFSATQATAAIAISKNYTEVRSFMQSLANQYSSQVSIFTLGVSDSGVPIEGLKIGNGPVNELVVATHHGNEFASTEVAKGVAADLASAPLVGKTVYVIPVLNISGYNVRNRYEFLNGVPVDPNRDYPGPCGTQGPFKLKSTKALAQFIDQMSIVTSATLHTFSPAVYYPWGISTQQVDTLYTDLFKIIGAAATFFSGYPVENSNSLYPADGTFEDYAFWRHGVWSMLFELGKSHNPGAADVADTVQKNVPGIRRMFEQAPLVRAEQHDFTGTCDIRLKGFDLRHD
jgi:carboxypeptidase T